MCVNLYFNSKKNSIVSIASFLKTFDFFKDFNSFIFSRKQNITIQNMRKPVNRLITKEGFKPKFYKEPEDDDNEKNKND